MRKETVNYWRSASNCEHTHQTQIIGRSIVTCFASNCFMIGGLKIENRIV